MITLGSMTAVGMKKRELEFSSHPGNLSLMRSFVRKSSFSFPSAIGFSPSFLP